MLSFWGQFDVELKKRRPRFAKKKLLFYHDNAPAHASAFAMDKLGELRYELVPDSPYFLGLDPCIYFLFPNLKKSLAGNKFGSNEKVTTVAALEKTYFLNGLKKLEHCWTKCI